MRSHLGRAALTLAVLGLLVLAPLAACPDDCAVRQPASWASGAAWAIVPAAVDVWATERCVSRSVGCYEANRLQQTRGQRATLLLISTAGVTAIDHGLRASGHHRAVWAVRATWWAIRGYGAWTALRQGAEGQSVGVR